MDSVTQAALGATVAAVVAGRHCNGKVLIAGALLGTLPDLDVLIHYGNDISNTVKHRGFSHSLLVIPPFSWLMAYLIHRFRPVRGWSFGRLWLMIFAALFSHPLLDAFTSYGTQLMWPFPGYYALSSVFIIDPLYTVPLLLAIGLGLTRPAKTARYSAIALLFSTVYLGWSLLAQQIIKERVNDTLQVLEVPDDHVLVMAAPFNTLLWRIVVLNGDHYLDGFASILDKDQEVRFIRQPRGQWPLPETPKLLKDLQTFSHNYLSYREEDNRLIVSDLRMGLANNLAFQFQFARRDGNQKWQLETPTRYQGIKLRGDVGQLIGRMLGNQGINPGDDSQ